MCGRSEVKRGQGHGAGRSVPGHQQSFPGKETPSEHGIGLIYPAVLQSGLYLLPY
jgi:hypothetical protein